MANITSFSSPGTGPLTHHEHKAEQHDLPLMNSAAGMPVAATSTVIQVHEEPQPQDCLVCSIFTTMYFNVCCLGLIALVFSVKSRDRKVLGDRNGARSYGSTAKWLNVAALVLGGILFVIIIILVVNAIHQIQNMLNHPVA